MEKCPYHGIELEYVGENGFGDDLWECPACQEAEDLAFSRCSICGQQPDDCHCYDDEDEDEPYEPDDYYDNDSFEL